MRRTAISSKPWLAVHLLGVLVMLHASVLLLYLERSQPDQVAALGWIFFSLGLLGTTVSWISRRWLGATTVAWSSGIKFFGSMALLAFAPPGQRAATLAVSLVILASGIAHLAGAFRLKREEQKHFPFVFSGAVNLAVSATVLSQIGQKDGALVVLLVAGATFTNGLALFHYGRQLRRLSDTGDSLMEQIRTTPRVSVRRTNAQT